jgi:branched-subunit amino acid aminotransferase/4-amino-4-deoxychorismate lyase
MPPFPRTGPINELLLSDPESGAVLEGSQTNFFAIVGGTVHTAGEGVLAGTVRRLTLEVCEREGIPVVLSPPRLADAAEKWEGAMISSTSRLLLPIDESVCVIPLHSDDMHDRVVQALFLVEHMFAVGD